ncbi:hypothetical protein M0R45_027657 [Rubus argutus]|uniref:Uncharacterized protein n=1 Tax=Rubus argutus TaxID=59490 RepID=A0AAW1X168_RUBAR
MLLFILETLAVWLLLTSDPPYFKVFCACATLGGLIKLFYSCLCRLPQCIRSLNAIEEYYVFLLVERSLPSVIIYVSWPPAKFWYIMVGTYLMSTICSAAIACNIHLTRRNLRLIDEIKRGNLLSENEEAFV